MLKVGKQCNNELVLHLSCNNLYKISTHFNIYSTCNIWFGYKG